MAVDRLGRPLRDDPYRGNVRVYAASNITLSGLQTIDGVTLESGDRVLCNGQTTTSQNGIYVASSGVWSRSRDLSTSDDFTGPIIVTVEEGTTYRNTFWHMLPASTITVGTDAVSFTSGYPAAQFGNGDALSVFGRASNSSGVRDDIAAANDGEVLQRSGTSLVFAPVGTASLGGDITTAGKALLDDATAADQRATLGAAASGANSDITALGGLTVPLPVNSGGTGSITEAAARTALGVLAKAGDTLTGPLEFATADSEASAGTVALGSATSNLVEITGTTTITSFGTVAAGVWRLVKFAGALTLTHNATSLILPTGGNITTAAGDTAIFVSEGSGNWRCYAYSKPSGGGTTNFLRADGTWAAPPGGGGGGIADAPSGGVAYVRKDEDWVSADARFAALSGADFTGPVSITGTGLPLTATRYANPANIVQRRANGSAGSPTAVAASDIVGGANAAGWDGSAFVIGAQMRPVVRGTVSTGKVPMSWTWATMNAAGTLADRMELTEEGVLKVGGEPVGSVIGPTSTTDGRLAAFDGTTGRLLKELSATEVTALLDTFTSSLKGLVPASGGGTTKYLRADGTWEAPSGGGGADFSGTPSDDQTFNSSATWTKPGSGTWAFIELWGGGQGGGRDNAGQNRLGGEGGEYVAFWVPFAFLPASSAVTIGAGGAGKTSNGAGVAGNPGGMTSFLGINARGGRIEAYQLSTDTQYYRRNGANAPIVAYGKGWISEPGASCILEPSSNFVNTSAYGQPWASTGSPISSIWKDMDHRTGRLSPDAGSISTSALSIFGSTDRSYSSAGSYGTPGNTVYSGGSGGGFNNSNTAIAASTSTNGGAGGAGGASGTGTAGTAPGGGGGAGTNANGGAGAAGCVRIRVY